MGGGLPGERDAGAGKVWTFDRDMQVRAGALAGGTAPVSAEIYKVPQGP